MKDFLRFFDIRLAHTALDYFFNELFSNKIFRDFHLMCGRGRHEFENYVFQLF